jgi:hypothetical protein
MTNPSPLSQRLIQAADTLEEFNHSLPELYPPDYSWSPSELRREAGHLAEEEQEAREGGAA